MFHTEIELPASDFKLNYRNSIMTIGSCFAENIGRTMKEFYLETDVNPFGVLYNPFSILKSIEILLDKKEFTRKDIFENHGIWNSFSHSSIFSDVKPENCLEKINNRISESSRFIENAKVLLITFGTAWVYELNETGNIVSNCHKLPASVFNRRRLSVEEIVKEYTVILEKFSKNYPDIKIIFSVSPVRHLKDTAHGNNLSKSTLLLAIDEICTKFVNAVYFPAFEILLDELRDYRFYADDMLHPSEFTIQYIWKKFSETFFDDESLIYFREMKQLNNDFNHRPLFPESEEFRVFTANLTKRKEKFIEKYPELKNKL